MKSSSAFAGGVGFTVQCTSQSAVHAMNEDDHRNVNSAEKLQQKLIEYMKQVGALRFEPLEAAFRAVPRHWFLPGISIEQAYQDDAIVTKMEGERPLSSSSQPTLMATMLEQLDLKPGHNVLEIGAGTGFNAALMAHLVGETGKITTVDIDQDIAEGARNALENAGYGRVNVIVGDGAEGYTPSAPYDRIMVTVGPSEVPPAWRAQLKPDGRLLTPLSFLPPRGAAGGQRIIAFERDALGLVSVSIAYGGFMPFRGAYPSVRPIGVRRIELQPESGVFLYLPEDDARQVDPASVVQLLKASGEATPTGLHVTAHEMGVQFGVWSGLKGLEDESREFGCGMSAEGEAANHDLVPYLFGFKGKFRSTSGLFEGDGLALLSRAPDQAPPSERTNADPPFELWIRSYGSDRSLTEKLLSPLRQWDAAGRPPRDDKWRVKVYGLDAGYTPAPDEIVIDRQVTRIVVDLTGNTTPNC